jgi:flagellar secretion chaperone FliS
MEMQCQRAWQSYRQVATETASAGQLVLMLYEGAIRFLEKAKSGFGQTDPLEFNQTINNNIIRAQAIINELNYSLNMSEGKDCAENFRRLYNYLDYRLQESNQHKREEGILEVVSRLTVLRDAWADMLKARSSGQEPLDLNPSAQQRQTRQ